jgi:integrase
MILSFSSFIRLNKFRAFPSLREIRTILGVLGDANVLTSVQIAAFTEIREGEIRGLRWEDYDPGRKWEHSGMAAALLSVNRSVWRQYIGLPKNGDTGVVPVISILAEQLNRYHLLVGSPRSDWMFSGEATRSTLMPLGNG